MQKGNAMIKKDTVHTKTALRTIYVLIFSDNGFFINHTTQKNMRDVYKDHYNLKWDWSKKQMAADKEKGYIPKMFILEEYDGTKADTFSRIVAWGKLLKDAGYQCTNGKTFNEYTENLLKKAQQHYDSIKDADLEYLLDDMENLFPNYGARNRPKPAPVQYVTVKVKFTEKEYELLEIATDFDDCNTIDEFCYSCVEENLKAIFGDYHKS